MGRPLSTGELTAIMGVCANDGTLAGARAKADVGRVVGSGAPPYGYRFEYTIVINHKTGKQKSVVTGLIVDEEEAAIVLLIYQWYTVDLLTGHEIAKRLSERHVKTLGESRCYKRKRASGVWEHNAVHTILKNEVYYGKYDYNGVKLGNTIEEGPNTLIVAFRLELSHWIVPLTFSNSARR